MARRGRVSRKGRHSARRKVSRKGRRGRRTGRKSKSNHRRTAKVTRRSRRVSRKRRTARRVNRRRNTRRLLRNIGGADTELVEGFTLDQIWEQLARERQGAAAARENERAAEASAAAAAAELAEAQREIAQPSRKVEARLWCKGRRPPKNSRCGAAVRKFDLAEIGDRKGEQAHSIMTTVTDDNLIIQHLKKLKSEIDSTKPQDSEGWLYNLISVIHSPSLNYDIGANQLIGNKPTQEDSLVINGQCGGTNHCLMAILDGHGQSAPQKHYRTPGQFASYVCALELSELFLGARKETRNAFTGGNELAGVSDDIKNTLTDTFDALLEACLANISKENMGTLIEENGTTAVVAYIENSLLTVANVGDCRAVLGYEDESGINAKQLSYEHVAGEISPEHHPVEFLITPKTGSEQDRILSIPGASISGGRLNHWHVDIFSCIFLPFYVDVLMYHFHNHSTL